MIIIDTVSSTRFSVDGVPYLKNYISEVAGNQITIFNAYDRKDIRVDWTHYGDITLNGVVYGNSADLQSNLLPVIYTRASLGGASGVQSIVAGTNITVDDTDPENPIVSSTGGGAVTSVNSDTGAVIVDLQSATDEGNETTNDVKFVIDADNYILVNTASQTIDFYTNAFGSYASTLLTRLESGGALFKNLTDPTTTAVSISQGQLSIRDASGGNYVVFTQDKLAVYDDTNTLLGEYDYPTGATSQIATLLDIPSPITIDATPTDGSSNAVSSNGVFDALATKVTFWGSAVDGTSVANTLTITPTYSQLIPANTFSAGDIIAIDYRATSPGAKTSITNHYFYVNTSNSLSGATQLALAATGAASRTIQFNRKLSVKGATTKHIAGTTNVFSDTGVSASMTTSTIDWTVDQYILFAIGHTVADQTMFGDFYSIQKT
jgi:hypothetical protein